MDRRAFLKTSGVAAGSAAVGFGVASQGTDQAVAAEELEEDIELLTDEYGVSHVYGDSLYEVGYGQGWAQARDRLFQLDLLRSIGRGELSQIIGPGEVSQDIASKRDLYNDEELVEQWEGATDDTREMIRGYTAGVNDQMDRLKARGELPGEYTLLARTPRAWKPTDTVAAITYMIGRFGVTTGQSLSNFETVQELFDRVEGEDADAPDIFASRREAWSVYEDINSVEVPQEHDGSITAAELDQRADGATPTGERALAYHEVPDEQLDLMDHAGEGESWGIDETALDGLGDAFGVTTGLFAGSNAASNAIIVDGEHTETGDAMLGGGPQMGLFKPPVIHEIGLHGPDFDVVGVGVVGTPGVVVGRTPDFAWTVTTSGDDMSERIAVDLDPDDHSRYEWDGEYHDFLTEEYVHEPNLWAGLIEGNTDIDRVEQEAAYVEQAGTKMPVIEYHPEADMVLVDRVTTRMNELDGAFMWANVGRADSREEFEESLSDFPFGFNFHLIDDEGIAYYRTGKFPDRPTDIDYRFAVPESLHEWNGFHEGILVAERDPDRGYVVNWNNAAAPGWRNGFGEFEWDGPQETDIMDRLTREAIIRTGDTHTIDDVEGLDLPADAAGNLSLADVEAIIEDCSVEQPFAPRFVPHFVAAARESDEEMLHAMADELEDWAGAEDLQRWAGPEQLERWKETTYSYRPGEDGHYPNGGMAIYEEIRHQMTELAFEDVLGGQAPRLDFDPTGGGTTGSDHAADHGASSSAGVLLIDALERAQRVRFDWLRGYGEGFILENVGRGETLDLSVSAGLWDWLFHDDAVELGDAGTGWTAPATTTGHRTLAAGRTARLHADATEHRLAIDGATDACGATVEPVSSDEDAGTFRFETNGDGTYRIHTADSDLVLQPADDGVCQDTWAGRDDQRWTVQRTAIDDREEYLRESMRAAAEVLADRFDSDDPSEWRMANRQSQFSPLGGLNTEFIPMTNRASYQQSIAIGQGDGSERDLARSVLPPSNSAHVNVWELLAAQFGQEPDRITEQLQLYSDHGYLPQPITRAAVSEWAVEERSID